MYKAIIKTYTSLLHLQRFLPMKQSSASKLSYFFQLKNAICSLTCRIWKQSICRRLSKHNDKIHFPPSS